MIPLTGPKYVRFKGHSMILSPEGQELLRSDNPFQVLAEVYQEAMFRGREEANRQWLKEANRRGGVVQWAKLKRKAKR
jgi:hypothetical protein